MLDDVPSLQALMRCGRRKNRHPTAMAATSNPDRLTPCVFLAQGAAAER